MTSRPMPLHDQMQQQPRTRQLERIYLSKDKNDINSTAGSSPHGSETHTSSPRPLLCCQEELRLKHKREYDMLIEETAQRAYGGVSSCQVPEACLMRRRLKIDEGLFRGGLCQEPETDR